MTFCLRGRETFTTPGESPLRYRQDNRNVSHGHEDVAVKTESTLQPGHAVNLHVMRCGGNIESDGRALAGAKSCGPRTLEVRVTLAAPLGAMVWDSWAKNENGEPFLAPRLRCSSFMPWQRPRGVANGAHRKSGV